MKLVVFEGINGSGKTTQLKLLHHHLVNLGYSVLATQQTGGTPYGEKLRKISMEHSDASPESKLFLMSSDRAEHSAYLKSIGNDYDFVLCDRWTYSTIAYQGFGDGVDLRVIERVNAIACDISPSMAIWLRIEPEKAISRIQSRGVYRGFLEESDSDRIWRVSNGYQHVFMNSPEMYRVEADRPPDEVFKRVLDLFSLHFGITALNLRQAIYERDGQ